MVVALERQLDNRIVSRVVDLRGECYAHRLSGELVWALCCPSEGRYIVIDEYGASWEQDARSFMAAYEASVICPIG